MAVCDKAAPTAVVIRNKKEHKTNNHYLSNDDTNPNMISPAPSRNDPINKTNISPSFGKYFPMISDKMNMT